MWAKRGTSCCTIVWVTFNACSSTSFLCNTERVHSVWIIEETVLFGINLDIFPSTAFPSAWNKMHFRHINVNIDVDIVISNKVATFWLRRPCLNLLHFGSPWLFIIIFYLLLHNVLSCICQTARGHDSILVGAFNHSCSFFFLSCR